MAGEFSHHLATAREEEEDYHQQSFDNERLAQYKATYEELGYVILPSPALLSPKDLVILRAASERVIDKTRAGEWTRRRIVGKQFPPFETDEERPDVWGVQHVMHPELKEPLFSQWYGSKRLVQVMAFLLGCDDESEVQMELFNLLVNPASHRFALRWHRDDVHEGASEEEEYDVLHSSHYGIQWNTALYDDDCLYVVPKSHTVVSTPEQRALSTTKATPDDPLMMPGALQVKLKPGDTVIYNNNILHTGRYTPDQKRATLHACMGNSRGGTARARNILQHDVRWMRSPEFSTTFQNFDKSKAGFEDGEEVEVRLRRMWELLLEMEKGAGSRPEALGYSQR